MSVGGEFRHVRRLQFRHDVCPVKCTGTHTQCHQLGDLATGASRQHLWQPQLLSPRENLAESLTSRCFVGLRNYKSLHAE